MKIQINSLEALERLIGGDSELEFDIRQSVVEAFTKKHLKNITTVELLGKVQQGLANEIKRELLVEVGSGYNKSFQLSERAKDLLSDKFKLTLSETIEKFVEQKTNERGIIQQINQQLETQAKWIANQLSEGVLEQRLNKLVDAKIKEKLGL